MVSPPATNNRKSADRLTRSETHYCQVRGFVLSLLQLLPESPRPEPSVVDSVFGWLRLLSKRVVVLFVEGATSLHQILGIRELPFSQRETEYAGEELFQIVKSLLLLTNVFNRAAGDRNAAHSSSKLAEEGQSHNRKAGKDVAHCLVSVLLMTRHDSLDSCRRPRESRFSE